MALKHYQDDQNKIRDYFPAQVAAAVMNSSRGKSTDHYFTPDEILSSYYHVDSVVTTHDPDMGAECDESVTTLLRKLA